MDKQMVAMACKVLQRLLNESGQSYEAGDRMVNAYLFWPALSSAGIEIRDWRVRENLLREMGAELFSVDGDPMIRFTEEVERLEPA